MSTSKSKGVVLRQLGGGPVRIVTTRMDAETRLIGDGAQRGVAVLNSLVAFLVESYREVKNEAGEGTDVWDMITMEGGRKYHVYLSGEDIFMVYAESRLA